MELGGIVRGGLPSLDRWSAVRSILNLFVVEINAASETSNIGGARRDRTADLLHAMQALSQLSYSPIGVEPRRLEPQAPAVKLPGHFYRAQ